jgi:hypothetical protein
VNWCQAKLAEFCKQAILQPVFEFIYYLSQIEDTHPYSLRRLAILVNLVSPQFSQKVSIRRPSIAKRIEVRD